jgi:hypothetical protein
MSKPSHEEIARATAGSLAVYLDQGVSIDHAIEKLDPAVNIENLSQLLEYYFLLTGASLDQGVPGRHAITLTPVETGGITDSNGTPVGVQDFVSLLPDRLREIDPATRQQLEVLDGEVRGQVDWGETTKHRYSTGNTAGQQFVCRTRQRTVDTAKNRVLVELLADIKAILSRFDNEFDPNSAEENPGDDETKFGWFDAWLNESPLRARLNEALENVYLDELTIGDAGVDRRELIAVEQSREPLYREAAALLRNLRRVRQGDLRKSEIKRLLSLDLFAPPREGGGTATLYELYWIFELLDQFQGVEFKKVEDKRGQLVAAWESDGSEYLLFNDWPGKHDWDDARGERDYVQIKWDLDMIRASNLNDQSRGDFMRRQQAVLEQKHALTDRVLGGTYKRKTPDIVFLQLDAASDGRQLEGIFIGEVKHSDDNSRLKSGLEQLLEYGAHARFGPELEWADGRPGPHIASEPDIVSTPGFELGYFVGGSNNISGAAPPGIQVYGFGETPDRPFRDSGETDTGQTATSDRHA